MVTRHARGKTVWVDLECPTEDELSAVMREFDIDERIHQEIATPTPYPLSIPFAGYAYLILHFPAPDTADGTRPQEVDFIVGKHFLITTHYEPVEALHTLHRVLEAEELLTAEDRRYSTGAFLERVVGQLYTATSGDIEQVGRKLERIERDIFSGKEEQAVRTISETARALLRYETELKRHREPLADFLAVLNAPAFFGTVFEEQAVHIEGRRQHAADLVASLRAVATELRVTNDSLLNASQNAVTKTLTVMAFTALPLTLIASIFGMNADPMPLVNEPNGFWAILGLMAAAGIGLYAYFRLRRWL